jgi:CHAT domain-containing protein
MVTLRANLSVDERELFDRSARSRSRLAAAFIAGPGQAATDNHRRTLNALQAEVRRLEEELSRKSAGFRAQVQPVTLEAIQRALPAGAALAEFVSYLPNDARTSRYKERRFAAYVLKSDGDRRWFDVGAAASIERDVAQLRAALANPSRVDVKEAARTVDARLLAPLRRLIGHPTRLFISPDGVLSLIPFAVLVDESGKFAAQTLNITYLTTGRDLLRVVDVHPHGPSVVIADPDFDAPTGTAARADSAPGGQDRQRRPMTFQRLQGTAEEGQAIRLLLSDITLLDGSNASEAAVKALRAPRILHIATHGFFLGSPRTASIGIGRSLTPTNTAPLPSEIDDALLRSGVALAGANTRRGDSGDDGILTGLEVAALDLHETELVVLSACETGVGDVGTGDGVYGLRRALVLAGSRSQVMSLWRVDDAATRDLMVDFYKRLLAGAGRADALRDAQLEMLAIPNREHPYYWAAFIQSGDWRPIAKPSVPMAAGSWPAQAPPGTPAAASLLIRR